MKKLTQKKENDTTHSFFTSRRNPTRNLFGHYMSILILVLLLFSIYLIFATNAISRRYESGEPDVNETIQRYLSSSFSSNIDNFYTYNIDHPMEAFFNTSAVTGFLFCTEQYPASEELKEYLRKGLISLTSNQDYLTAAAIYASASNTLVTSQYPDDESGNSLSLFLDDMIYDYNSNALEKNKIIGSTFNTFLFQYQDYVIISKDLTNLSGIPHATMFMLLDPDAFSSFLFRANGTIPYQINVYDPHDGLLFTNTENRTAPSRSQLLTFASGNFQTKHVDNMYYIYCRSDSMGLQYLLELDLTPLPGDTAGMWRMYLFILLAVLLAVAAVAALCFFYFRRPASQFSATMDLLEIKENSPRLLASSFNRQVGTIVNENTVLRQIIRATSTEALSHLFARLITGEPVEKEEATITLTNTGYGFRLDDVYIAGILHQTTSEFIKASSRYRILNLLDSIFDKFKEKEECNICAFLFDERSFVIIASFPSGTSIAKGKTKINDLTQQIAEGITFLKLPMIVTFGHMYNSILDLSFSYNEAFRTMHYELNDTLPADKMAFATTSEQIHEKNTDTPASQDIPEQIDRRASQIARLIWDDYENQNFSSLIERTLSDIFEAGSVTEQSENCRRLVSAVISHMISYPFINDSHLTNVYDAISPQIQSDADTDTLRRNAQDALSTLCHDFSEAVKKQRNPYIVAAQEYIGLHYSNPDLSLEEIAENLKIAPNYLSTIFSKNLGIKLFEYVSEYRLEKSIELLLHSNKTVNDISMECGFGSSRNYIRIFKNHKEITPGAFRKQHLPAAQTTK